MNDPHQEFDFYLRRWQVRLFIAGFIIPTALFVMAIMLRMETDVSAMGCSILAGAFLLTALLLQGWRSAAAEKAAKARRKLRQRAEATAVPQSGWE